MMLQWGGSRTTILRGYTDTVETGLWSLHQSKYAAASLLDRRVSDGYESIWRQKRSDG